VTTTQKAILLLLCSSLLAFPASHFATDKPDTTAAGMDPARLAKIPERMKGFVDAGTAAGFVTLLARHGHLASLSAVGFQDREQRSPMRTDTIFQIMSMTKPITCTGVVILLEEGRLALIDPVEKYLPDFKGQKLNDCAAGKDNCVLGKPSHPITIQELMTHTSGLSGTPKGYAKNEHTLAEAVSTGAKQPLEFPPGSKWSYSNMGIATLGRIIEVVSGQPYEQFMSERIFTPLAMRDTHFVLPAEKHGRLAAVYTTDHDKLKRLDEDPFRPGYKYISPEGGLYSTAGDLARFYQMMLNKGTLDGRRILSAAGVDLMTTVQTGDLKTGFAPGMGYGLGWAIVREPAGMFRMNSLGTFGHGGAYRTYGWIDPAKDMIGVILFQRTNGGGDIADEINSFMEMSAAAIER
jgi:CubicO group peptidase (beta-lactamase class C family)